MGRPHDPARVTRERLLMLERREKAQAEATAVREGVAETVALDRARGAAIQAPPGGRRAARAGAHRRLAGLAWLTRKGRLTEAQRSAGERYGAAYRMASRDRSIPSTLDVKPGISAPGGKPLTALVAQAHAAAQASARLARYRELLREQSDMVAACDLVCGRELTPREAAGGDREAQRLEAVLRVALDILAAGRIS